MPRRTDPCIQSLRGYVPAYPSPDLTDIFFPEPANQGANSIASERDDEMWLVLLQSPKQERATVLDLLLCRCFLAGRADIGIRDPAIPPEIDAVLLQLLREESTTLADERNALLVLRESGGFPQNEDTLLSLSIYGHFRSSTGLEQPTGTTTRDETNLSPPRCRQCHSLEESFHFFSIASVNAWSKNACACFPTISYSGTS